MVWLLAIVWSFVCICFVVWRGDLCQTMPDLAFACNFLLLRPILFCLCPCRTGWWWGGGGGRSGVFEVMDPMFLVEVGRSECRPQTRQTRFTKQGGAVHTTQVPAFVSFFKKTNIENWAWMSLTQFGF